MTTLWISQSNGRCVDLFDEVGFSGHRFRLFGPADYVSLWVAPEEWGEHALSIVTGPGAYVQCFEDLNLEQSVVWLLPDERIPDVTMLGAVADLDSIRLYDRPPYRSEPGFPAYAQRSFGNRDRPYR